MSGVQHDGRSERPRRHRKGVVSIVALVPLCLFAALVSSVPSVAAGQGIRVALAWIPSMGIEFSLMLDGLSLLFGLLISGIGFVVIVYSGRYLHDHPHLGRFLFFLLSFLVAMLGLVMAGDLITLFVFWELTTVTSYLLIGFDSASARARRSALQALLVTGAGGLALLAGFILLAIATGSYSLPEILEAGENLRRHGLYLPILVLVLAGAFTKSAQLPFHFWLPNAMAAPTPVSAFLHSATMVKAGIYLLARLHPALADTAAWTWSLTLTGAATAVFASVLAMRQTDLKQCLAYTTLMALGTLTMFLGAEAEVAIVAAITFLLVHSLYKAALFLVVGNIDHSSGTRDAERLRGLRGAMPLTAIAAGTAGLSMAGFPPFLGFIGKELKYEGALAIAAEPAFVATAAVLANAMMVAVAGIVALRPFYGKPGNTPRAPDEAPKAMVVGPLLVAGLGLAFGLAPGLISASLVQPAASAVLGRTVQVDLALWHGINLPLLLSVLTGTLGILMYLMHRRIREGLARLDAAWPVKADRVWDELLVGLKAIAAWQARWLQSGILRNYLFIVFASLAGLVLATLTMRSEELPLPMVSGLLMKDWLVVGLIAAGTLLTAFTASRLAAICGLGVVGVGISLVFLMFGAADVAITQLLVETLVVVLVAAAMRGLPRLVREAPSARRRLDAVLAVGVGLSVSVTLLSVLEVPMDRSLTEFFEYASVPEAFGRNIVNVILVDFRALDTFGEIAVVAVAALAAFGLIRRAGRAGRGR